MPRVNAFPRCWDRKTQEEVTRWAWYVNQDRKPHPRAVLVKGEDITVVEVSLIPWWDEQPDKAPCLDCGSTKPDSRARGLCRRCYQRHLAGGTLHTFERCRNASTGC